MFLLPNLAEHQESLKSSGSLRHSDGPQEFTPESTEITEITEGFMFLSPILGLSLCVYCQIDAVNHPTNTVSEELDIEVDQ